MCIRDRRYGIITLANGCCKAAPPTTERIEGFEQNGPHLHQRGQENSLGRTSVRLPGRYRAWLPGQRGAIAARIICELPGNCARIYFLAEGSNGVPAPSNLLHSIRHEQLWPEFWLPLVSHLCGRDKGNPVLKPLSEDRLCRNPVFPPMLLGL